MSALQFDTEVYRDYFLCMFGDGERFKYFEQYPGRPLDEIGLRRMLRTLLVSFNGNHFDVPVIAGAMKGIAHSVCTAIINNGLKSWQTERQFGLILPQFNHIDLIDVAPGIASLKAYGARLHSKSIQDLPYDPDAVIGPEQRIEIIEYCKNDIRLTRDLYDKLKPAIELREMMSHDVDLRSKSDAQIAEISITGEVEKLAGKKVERAEVTPGARLKYNAPEFIRFETPELKKKLNEIENAEFIVKADGGVIEPPELKGSIIKIGQNAYRMGVGGLHSTEKAVSHFADSDTLLIDRDVNSYYPNIILRCGFSPISMGRAFNKVYKRFLNERLAAKARQGELTWRIAELEKELADAVAEA